MALVPYEPDDFLEETRERLTYQFKDKIVIDKYLQLITDQHEEIQQLFIDLLQKRSIDEAIGQQLDVIGEIVGQPRTLINLDLYKYFAFLGYPNGDTYGDLDDPAVGGVWYSQGTPIGGNYTLDDNTYRLFIKSKILKNRTASTPEELLQFLSYLFGDIRIFLREGDAEFTLFFGRQLSQLERNLLTFTSYELGYPSRLIPKTIGVGINFGYFQEEAFFAFQGVPNAKGFGDLNESYGWGNNWSLDWGGNTTGGVVGGYFASYTS